MKSPDELAIRIVSILNESKSDIDSRVKCVSEFIRDHEKEVRKDEKIVTRKECAEVAIGYADFDEFEFGSYDEGVIDTATKIHQAIMNTEDE